MCNLLFTSRSRRSSFSSDKHTPFDSFVKVNWQKRSHKYRKRKTPNSNSPIRWIHCDYKHQWNKMTPGRNVPFVNRKIRKNFISVLIVVLTGILVCFALAHLVILADPQSRRDCGFESNGFHSSKTNFRLLKGNRRSILKNSDTVSSSAFLQK